MYRQGCEPNDRSGADEGSPAHRSSSGKQLQPLPEQLARRQTPSVLVVDDDPNQRQPLHMLLEKWGYRVASAESGKHAIELAQNHHPSLAFLDIAIPDMNGYQLAASLKSSLGQNCPRLFAISASIENSDTNNRLFDRIFEKPVDLRALRETLQTSLPLQSGHP